MRNRLKELRTAQGWSQAVMGEKLDVSRQSIIAIESGRFDPSLPLAFKIARLLGEPIESVFQDDATQQP
ncbi:helix-turn-helix transcriptional regulator [Devosia sp. J2-20]|uniref:helix-turn-helix transcriptional regulator n=1 Tax=Devosia TaxID=46913 RepID=UPI0022B04851|nr:MULTISPECIES: helix-turn-helix transcriptional regulator [Devosia]MCZ4345039.1 helix-turn-helix transcriptional regulator [Devosia neptuniae]WDQ98477.1 helix-turn-helix transcriptional regulator [Devosia sp. J2-20]